MVSGNYLNDGVEIADCSYRIEKTKVSVELDVVGNEFPLGEAFDLILFFYEDYTLRFLNSLINRKQKNLRLKPLSESE